MVQSNYKETKHQRRVKNKLHAFVYLQRIVAVLCIFIPLILFSTDKDEYYPSTINYAAFNKAVKDSCHFNIDTVFVKCHPCIIDSIKTYACSCQVSIITSKKIQKDSLHFRESISHYAHSSNSYLFGMLYTMAAMLFIYNGVIYGSVLRKQPGKATLSELVPLLNVLAGVSLLMVVLNPVYDSVVWHVVFAVAFFLFNVITITFLPAETQVHKVARWLVATAAVASLVIGLISKYVLWGEWAGLFLIAVYLFIITWNESFKENLREGLLHGHHNTKQKKLL